MKFKRKKRTRIRGRRTVGYGARKKHRDKGSRGGKGWAGTGKRAGQLKTYVLRYIPNYLGKRGFTSLKKIRMKKEKKDKIINLGQIQEQLDNFLKKKIAKQTPEGVELLLNNYKILSGGANDLKIKIKTIKARQFSKKAKEKIEKAGGKIITS